MKISVFGIGYVGAVASACMVDMGHDVIAVDMDPVKVECIKEGRSPIVEPKLDELIKKGQESGKLSATLSTEEAVMNTDVSLICVGTPSNPDGSLKLDYIKDCCAQIGEAMKKKEGFHVVCLRSTCVPGTGRKIAIPALEAASGKTEGVDFGFSNNPEFLRESSAVSDYYNPPKIVVGADNEKTGKIIMDIYEGIEAPRVLTDIAVSEGVKYADNAWHAMKVGFANEMGNILKELGIDSHKVMNIFFKDTKLNISSAYLLPGFAFGGSCLPKDVRAIRASGQSNGLKTPIFDALMEANEEQVRRAVSMIRASGKKNITLMGLAFKSGTDDLRESPLVVLADTLIKENYNVKIYDPCVFQAKNMHGANQKYIHEVIPHISKCLVENMEDAIELAELIIIGNSDNNYANIFSVINDNTQILDLVRLKDNRLETLKYYSGICW